VTRILTLSNMYPPHHYGGYELSCRDVMDRLRARGHEVTVLTTTMRVAGTPDVPGEREQGIRRDLEFYWDDHRLVSPGLRARLRLERVNQAALEAALAVAQPDVVSVWNMGAMSLGLLTTLTRTGVPIVYCVCDAWPDYGPRLDAWSRLFRRRPRLGRLLTRMTGVPTVLPDLGAEGTFCFVSAATRRWNEEHSAWSYPDATVVYSGIDVTDFPITDGAGRRPWSGNLLWVGRVDPRKGLPVAIKALGRLPLATLSIVGSGDQAHLAEVLDQARRSGVAERVQHRVVPRSELAEVYRDADALLFTSTWDEPFGLVPIEAMACGAPVVASPTGGATEFLFDGTNCLAFPPGDAEGLAASVERLAVDPDLRARLVAGGRSTARELTVDRLAEVLETWHVAASERFRNGRPSHRPPPVVDAPSHP
jgi:glycogen(starch) synthase